MVEGEDEESYLYLYLCLCLYLYFAGAKMGIEMVECEDEELYGKEYLQWKKKTLGNQVNNINIIVVVIIFIIIVSIIIVTI